MRKICIIPARLESSRFPGKPLFKINGKPMVEWVYEACAKANITELYLATPNEEIIDFCISKNYKYIKTSHSHLRGLDRIFEAYNSLEEKKDKDDDLIEIYNVPVEILEIKDYKKVYIISIIFELLREQVSIRIDNSLKVKANNREYLSKGVQTKIDYHWYGKNESFNDLEIGFRFHYDEEDRFQWEDIYNINNGFLSLSEYGDRGSQGNRISSANSFATYKKLKDDNEVLNLIDNFLEE